MNKTDLYISTLEKEVDRLQEENERLQSYFDNYRLFSKEMFSTDREPLFRRCDRLNFYYQICYSVDYGYDTKLKHCGIEKLRKAALQINPDCFVRRRFAFPNNMFYVSVSTRFNGLHYPVVDCDSLEQLRETKKALDTINLKYAVFESSPDHFWVIIDSGKRRCKKVASFLLHHRLGDERYLKMAKKRGMFLLRASSRNGHSVIDRPELDSSEENYSNYFGYRSDWSENFNRFILELSGYYKDGIADVLGQKLHYRQKSKLLHY